jgi:uncharacterized membrane protein
MFKIDLADISTTICTASIIIDASLKLLLIVASPKLKSLTALISSVLGFLYTIYILGY